MAGFGGVEGFAGEREGFVGGGIVGEVVQDKEDDLFVEDVEKVHGSGFCRHGHGLLKLLLH